MKDGLPIWTIYRYPRDYPQGYVVRRSVTTAEGTKHDARAFRVASLEAARLVVPAGCVRMERHPDDDPVIVEVWL
jgi:hypothetical protein